MYKITDIMGFISSRNSFNEGSIFVYLFGRFIRHCKVTHTKTAHFIRVHKEALEHETERI